MSEIHETHQRLFQLVARHGDYDERKAIAADLKLMREVRGFDPTGHWEPMESVVLPSFLVSKCKRVAKERQERAKRFLLDKHGAIRAIEDEIRSVEAQTACQLILGLPLFGVANDGSARSVGNVGANISAFCPKPGSFQLIIGEKEPHNRTFFLFHVDGSHRYACQGWIRAGLGQRDDLQRTYTRQDAGGNAVTSRPYLVPTDMLSPLRSWFE